MSKKFDFSDIDLRRLDLTRKYSDDLDGDEGLGWHNHLLLYTVVVLLAIFIVWANLAHLDEVARGDGKVIPSSEVQMIQSLEGGIIDEILVAEGDKVDEGQPILRIHNTQFKSDFAQVTQRYTGLAAAVARLQAEAEGKEEVAFPDDVRNGAPESVTAELAAFEANRKQRSTQAAVFREQLSQKQQEVAELNRRIADVSAVLRLAQDEHAMVAPMVDKGAASKMELLQLDRQIAQQRAELNGIKLALPRAQAAVKEVQQRINELDSTFRAEAQSELSEKTRELNTIRESLSAYEDKTARTEVKAPLAGVVKDIKITTVGGVARAGETIMEIVPLEDRLIIEARIKPADVAFIHGGMRAVVRLTAFDASIYGSLEGEVIDISADSITNEKGESFYRVNVRTKETKVERSGKTYDIIPGMQATVDIITGRKSVMTYLLKPFVKASQTALRER